MSHNSSDWTPGIVLDPQQSPEISSGKAQGGNGTHTSTNGTKVNGTAVTIEGPPLLSNTPTITHHSVPIPQPPHRVPSPAIASPCFLHSKLQGPSLMDWLGSFVSPDQNETRGRAGENGHVHQDGTASDYSDPHSPYGDDDDERQYAPSITKQLAATAVGVREVSKKLGQSSHLVCDGAPAPRRCSQRVQVVPASTPTSRASSS